MKGKCEQHFVESTILIKIWLISTVSMVSVLLLKCRSKY